MKAFRMILPLFLITLATSSAANSGSPELGLQVASVQPPPQSDAGTGEDLQYAARDIGVRLWHDKSEDEVYERGEPIRLYFRTNQDAYVVVYRIDVHGSTEVIWPTTRYDDGFAFGGHTYTLPSRGSPIRLAAGDSQGVEYVEAIASEYPFDLRGLALDFRFDPEEEEPYGHKISGDPFLAVNDINFAITGLEEDQDYIVTDWTHLYVGSRVDYPRYTCEQCHGGDQENQEAIVYDYEPYTDTCTQVTVYSDWGWYRNWYVRFGWYPLYCDPPYYYWDYVYARPYYYTYYPVYYSWPTYPVYVRPYPVYSWHTSPGYRGDYLVQYQRDSHRTGPLYDIGRRGESKGRGVTGSAPPSVSPRMAAAGETVSRDRLVRASSMPARGVGGRTIQELPVSQQPRAGIRTTRRNARTVRSLTPNDSPVRRDRVGTPEIVPGNGRRWTQPVIQNTERGSTRRPEEPRNPGRIQSRNSGRRLQTSPDSARNAQRLRSGSNGRKTIRSTQAPTRSRQKLNQPQRTTPRQGTVRPKPSTGSSKRSSKSKATVRSAPRGGSRVAPAKRSGSPSRATPRSGARAGSRGGSRGGSKGGGRGKG